MWTSRQCVLSLATLLAVTVAIRGQCTIPSNWKVNSLTNQNQAWGTSKIASGSGNSWELMTFTSNNEYVNLQSNTRYQCIESRVETNGFTTIVFQHATLGTYQCFTGIVQGTSRTLYYKRSVETSNQLVLDNCAQQSGIDGDVYRVMIRSLPTTWHLNQFEWTSANGPVIPPGTYLFSISLSDSVSIGSWECVDQLSSTIIVTSTYFLVNSPCVDPADTSYGNLFARKLYFTDVITSAALGLPGDPISGFITLNTQTTNSAGEARLEDIYVAKYEVTTDGELRLFFERTTSSDNVHRAYYYYSSVPANRNPARTQLRNTQCASTNYCQNGGTCTASWDSSSCKCTAMYEGTTCQTMKDACDPNPCLNNGGCTADTTDPTKPKCTCQTGFTGTLCEMKDLCSGANAVTCMNGGTCYTYKNQNDEDKPWCQCMGTFSGDRCEIFDPCATVPCQNNGVCISKVNAVLATDFKCTCLAGFYGNTCELVGAGPCGPQPCTNGGECVADGTDYRCNCLAGFTGKDCQSGSDSCGAVNPCKNGANCVSLGDDIYCDCPNTYSGAYCENYDDWFVIMLVMVILTAIIIFVVIIICGCYCCCGWRPGGSNKGDGIDPFRPESQMPEQTFQYPTYQPDPSPPGQVEFNFVPSNKYIGFETT